jgi:hypothetical protein
VVSPSDPGFRRCDLLRVLERLGHRCSGGAEVSRAPKLPDFETSKYVVLNALRRRIARVERAIERDEARINFLKGERIELSLRLSEMDL